MILIFVSKKDLSVVTRDIQDEIYGLQLQIAILRSRLKSSTTRKLYALSSDHTTEVIDEGDLFCK